MTELKKAVRRYSNGKIPLDRSKVVEMVNYISSYSTRMDPSDISFNSISNSVISEEIIEEENIDEIKVWNLNGKPAIFIKTKDNKRTTVALVDYLFFNHPFNMKEIVEVKDLFDNVEYERNYFRKLYSNAFTNTPNMKIRERPNNIHMLLKRNERLSDEIKLFLELNGII